ncbi:hypothetical protein V6N13_023542 [Hibiscus sabdariffa]
MEIGDLRHLQIFDAGNTSLTGSIPVNIFNKSSLKWIYLGNNKLSGTLPIDICCDQSRLEVLFLPLNQLNGEVPLGLDGCHKLRNKLTGSVPRNIGNCSFLRTISFGKNRLTGEIPEEIANLRHLRHLHIGANNLTGSIPPKIFNISTIDFIALHLNNLSGQLPSSTEYRLLKLTLLVLAQSKLKWQTPQLHHQCFDPQGLRTINGDLNGLSYLSFAENSMQGPIPESFGHLVSLEFLDLSRKDLSGVIPKSMEALSHLKYLNVTFNRPEGEIPTGGPFRNLSAESFGSNKALCGLPRLQVPPCKASSHYGLKKALVLVVKYILPAAAFAMLLVTLSRKEMSQIGNSIATGNMEKNFLLRASSCNGWIQ